MERTWQRLLSMAIWEMEAACPVISPTCLLVLPCHSRMSLSSPPLAHRLKALLWAKQWTPLRCAVTVCRTLHRDRSVILIVLSREHVTKPSSCMLDTCCSIYGCYALVYDVSTCLVHLIYTSVTCTLDWVITHNMEITRLDFRCSQPVAVFEG